MYQQITKKEQDLIENYRRLNTAGRDALLEKSDDLTAIKKYTASEEELLQAEEELRAKVEEVRRICCMTAPSDFYNFTANDIKALEVISGPDCWDLMSNCLQYGYFIGCREGSAATL